MKEFLKMTLATICGILVLGAVSTLMITISLVGMLASEGSTPSVKDGSVFVLNLSGTVNERAEADSPLNALLGMANMSAMGLDDIVSAIRKAQAEPKIKGIYIEGGAASFDSPATAQQIRDALAAFKKSGKWIIAYADVYTQSSYYVASVADSVFLNKTGSIDFKGLGGKMQYMKGLYDKLGVNYQAVRVGKYKSAVEGNILTSMSDNNRAQTTAYLQGIWQHWLSQMAASRKVTKAQLEQLANDSIMVFADAQDYVKGRLIDRLIYPEKIKDVIARQLKQKADKDIEQLFLSDMMALPEAKEKKGDEVAVYYAYGEIIDEAASALYADHAIVGNKTVDDLNALADDDDVKAVVLRVNSGGGSAVASEQIWHAVKRLKAKKPVVVSMGGMAASGGYMISCAANYIFAEPTTLTGSIGIFALVPNFSGLVTDKLGVTFDGVTTNKYGDYENRLVLEKNNGDVIAQMQQYVDRGYSTFLGIVGDGRGMTKSAVNEVAQGRVWVAGDALKVKLIDKIGSLNDAVDKAAKLAKLKQWHSEAYPAAESWMDQFMSDDKSGSYLDAQLRQTLGNLYEPVMELRRNQVRNRLQARYDFLFSE